MVATCGPSNVHGNLGLAFGLTAAAGLSTTLGAAVAFLAPTESSRAKLFLAGSLALAAGVMTYVSFAEIFVVKAVGAFEACISANYAYLYATLCFFGGVLLTFLFDKALHSFEHWIARREADRGNEESHDVNSKDGDLERPVQNSSGEQREGCDPEAQVNNIVENGTGGQGEIQAVVEEVEGGRMSELIDDEVGHDGRFIADLYSNGTDRKALARMGMFAGIAIAFHNFPEGLATFVSVLEDPSVGVSVAIAIAIHNIPEGICVAMPIFYATGSRGKAFFWATMSGITEILGAILGYVVLESVFNQIAYGVLFGIVGGMMIYISLKELLPTAHRYDPEDKIATLCFFVGMAVMALSLVLFKF
mmetsp:Transcript_3666/g.6427  ORF Transcript_3666/g.6427 Transcript_3666/m.6427 type:complete len:362 (+) Transcript_3666:152-1237(+)